MASADSSMCSQYDSEVSGETSSEDSEAGISYGSSMIETDDEIKNEIPSVVISDVDDDCLNARQSAHPGNSTQSSADGSEISHGSVGTDFDEQDDGSDINDYSSDDKERSDASSVSAVDAKNGEKESQHYEEDVASPNSPEHQIEDADKSYNKSLSFNLGSFQSIEEDLDRILDSYCGTKEISTLKTLEQKNESGEKIGQSQIARHTTYPISNTYSEVLPEKIQSCDVNVKHTAPFHGVDIEHEMILAGDSSISVVKSRDEINVVQRTESTPRNRRVRKLSEVPVHHSAIKKKSCDVQRKDSFYLSSVNDIKKPDTSLVGEAPENSIAGKTIYKFCRKGSVRPRGYINNSMNASLEVPALSQTYTGSDLKLSAWDTGKRSQSMICGKSEGACAKGAAGDDEEFSDDSADEVDLFKMDDSDDDSVATECDGNISGRNLTSEAALSSHGDSKQPDNVFLQNRNPVWPKIDSSPIPVTHHVATNSPMLGSMLQHLGGRRVKRHMERLLHVSPRKPGSQSSDTSGSSGISSASSVFENSLTSHSSHGENRSVPSDNLCNDNVSHNRQPGDILRSHDSDDIPAMHDPLLGGDPETNRSGSVKDSTGSSHSSPQSRITSSSSETASDADDETVKEKRRARIIQEILHTETTYQHHLTLAIKHFEEPLQTGSLMPAHIVVSLFSNLRQILSINQELFHHLRTLSIGQAFLKLGPFLKLYSTYANNHERALATLMDWDQKSSEFSAWRRAQEAQEDMAGLKMNALLITPVQRIPRYKLLLQDLLNHTPVSHTDHAALTEAVRQVTAVAAHINDHIRQQDNFMKMLAIQKSLSGPTAPRLLVPGRTFIKEGPLKKVTRSGGRTVERMFFLFSDIIMYSKSRLLDTKPRPLDYKPQLRDLKLRPHHSHVCCCILPLRHCHVTRVFGQSQGQGALFTVKCKNESLLLYSDQKTVTDWISALHSAIQEHSDCRQTLRKVSSAKQPLRRAAIARLLQTEKKQPLTAAVIKTPEKSSPIRNLKRTLMDNDLNCLSIKKHLKSQDALDIKSNPCKKQSPLIEALGCFTPRRKKVQAMQDGTMTLELQDSGSRLQLFSNLPPPVLDESVESVDVARQENSPAQNSSVVAGKKRKPLRSRWPMRGNRRKDTPSNATQWSQGSEKSPMSRPESISSVESDGEKHKETKTSKVAFWRRSQRQPSSTSNSNSFLDNSYHGNTSFSSQEKQSVNRSVCSVIPDHFESPPLPLTFSEQSDTTHTAPPFPVVKEEICCSPNKLTRGSTLSGVLESASNGAQTFMQTTANTYINYGAACSLQ